MCQLAWQAKCKKSQTNLEKWTGGKSSLVANTPQALLVSILMNGGLLQINMQEESTTNRNEIKNTPPPPPPLVRIRTEWIYLMIAAWLLPLLSVVEWCNHGDVLARSDEPEENASICRHCHLNSHNHRLVVVQTCHACWHIHRAYAVRVTLHTHTQMYMSCADSVHMTNTRSSWLVNYFD